MTPRRKAVIVDWELEELHLYPISDTHVGSVSCRENQIKKVVEIIKGDPHACVIGGGDYTESIAPSDRRWSPREMAETLDPDNLENMFYCQALRFCKLFEETRGKWGGLILGNHEQTAISRYFVNPAAIIAERLGCPYVGDANQSNWFLFRMRSAGKVRSRVKVFVAHGWGGGELAGSSALKLQRTMWRKDAHIIITGHHHKPDSSAETVESVSGGGMIMTEQRVGIVNYAMCGQHGYQAVKTQNENPSGYCMISVRMEHDKGVKPGVLMQQI
jgi:hypothetical protein